MSTTPSERKALLFLAALLVLGAGARAFASARRQSGATASSPAALTQQIAAVDSQRVKLYEKRRGAASRRSARAGGRSKTARAPVRARPDSVLIVDVDRASAAELEALPRVGPALAKRIVKDRDENGPFGSLDALTRVNGIGPKLVMYLAAHVTFSGSMRPPSALSERPGAVPRMGRFPPPG